MGDARARKLDIKALRLKVNLVFRGTATDRPLPELRGQRQPEISLIEDRGRKIRVLRGLPVRTSAHTIQRKFLIERCGVIDHDLG